MSSVQRSQRDIFHITPGSCSWKMCYLHLFFLLYALENHLYLGKDKSVRKTGFDFINFFTQFLISITFMGSANPIS